MIEITDIDEVLQHCDDIDAIVFDLDDTLYSEKEYVRSGFRAIESSLLFANDIDNVADKLWKAFENGEPAIDFFLKAEGVYSEELKQQCLRIYRLHTPSISLYSPVNDILRSLRSKGIKIGILTDGRPEGQRAKLKALKVVPLVDEVIITDELGGLQCRKPNQAGFNRIQSNLNVPFERMCYVGDNIGKDFIAPEQLGMECIWFNNRDGLYYQLSKTAPIMN